MIGRYYNFKRHNDYGYSLIELVVVISIMAIMVGLMSLGISMMFSKDAEAAAKTIDDGLSEVRMLAMSKEGTYTFVLKLDDNKIEIQKGGSEYKTIDFKRKATVSVDGGNLSSAKTSGDFTVEFDKGNGSVKKLDNGLVTETTKVVEITVTAEKLTSKTSTVFLMPTTGRHYINK